jgi:GntR family transcriptional regulator/MocR family aminotransferase
MPQHDLSLWTIPSTAKRPTSLQIEEFMISLIKSRAVKPYESIPSHRILAKLNRVNRNTTLRAYTKLISTGWLAHQHGGRARVADHFPGELNTAFNTSLIVEKAPIPLSSVSLQLKISASSYIDFIEIGRPLLERAAVTKKSPRNTSVLTSDNHSSDGERAGKLSNQIWSQLLIRGFQVRKENLTFVRGRAECLSGIFKAISSGSGVIVNTAPADLILYHAISQCANEAVNIQTSFTDIVKRLEIILSKTKIRAVYIRPSSSYPFCESMDEATRQKLVEMATTNGFYIVEEDDDHELWWGKSPSSPLVQSEHKGHVIYCCALSRISPYMQHLRIIIATSQFISHMESAKLVQGYHDPSEEKNIFRLLAVNELIPQSRQIRLVKQKHLRMLDEILRLQLGKQVTYELPEAGTALWINFPKKLDLVAAIESINNEGHPLKYTVYNRHPAHSVHSMRLDFSTFSEAECRKMAIKFRSILTRNPKHQS